MAARMHQRSRAQGSPPALDQRRQIEWQGRQAGHRLVVAVHQPNLRWFGDTDSRGQYGYRLITGAYTSSLWRMTFGYTAPIQWDTRIKGRGVVGIGEAEELIHHAQLAWMPAEERRRYALTGPATAGLVHRHAARPLDHRARHQPRAASSPAPPWSASPATAMSRPMSRPRQHPWYQRKDAPMSRPMSRPRTPSPCRRRFSARPGGPAGTAPRTRRRRAARHQHWGERAAPRRRPRPTATPTPGERLIIGIADAASYLGYDKPESFRRARTRNPIPGEGKTDDGRPCWTPAALRSWQSKRKIAGNRTPADEPD